MAKTLDHALPRHPLSSILHPRFRPRAFTLLELTVLLAIIAILVSIFVPYVRNIRESNNRVRCSDNLRRIQSALYLYARDNGGLYPSVRQAEGVPGYQAYTGAAAGVDPFAPGSAVKENDVTASLWLLVRSKFASPGAFVCPSTTAIEQPVTGAVERWGNFTSDAHLSYSYATPFSTLPDYRLNGDRLQPDFAVIADMNPGISPSGEDHVVAPAHDARPLERSRGNSRNHGKAGQNVLFGDGHVEFAVTPYCGYGGDNIYTALRGTRIFSPEKPDANGNGVLDPAVGPAWYSDSYLVPVAGEGR
jgi:prepilin-type processing-associated H-X9-DG protein